MSTRTIRETFLVPCRELKTRHSCEMRLADCVWLPNPRYEKWEKLSPDYQKYAPAPKKEGRCLPLTSREFRLAHRVKPLQVPSEPVHIQGPEFHQYMEEKIRQRDERIRIARKAAEEEREK